MKINDITRRTIIIGAIVAVLAISCIIKLFNLQIVNGEEYRIQADNRTIRTYATKAPRGEILTGMVFRLLKIGADTAFRYLKLILLQKS